MDNTASKVSEIVKRYGGKDLQFAKDKDESDDIWAARKSLRFSLMALKPGSSTYSTDICVPISELSAIIRETKKDLKDSGIFAAALGHGECFKESCKELKACAHACSRTLLAFYSRRRQCPLFNGEPFPRVLAYP